MEFDIRFAPRLLYKSSFFLFSFLSSCHHNFALCPLHSPPSLFIFYFLNYIHSSITPYSTTAYRYSRHMIHHIGYDTSTRDLSVSLLFPSDSSVQITLIFDSMLVILLNCAAHILRAFFLTHSLLALCHS